jgi:uncharacterized membrane protein
MTTTPEPAPKPRRPRRPRVEMEVFGSFTPWKNPAAVYAYAVSLAALTPVVGAVLGPVAIALGVVGFVRFRLRREVRGANFAVAGMILGAVNTLLNAAGVWCIGRGLNWW